MRVTRVVDLLEVSLAARWLHKSLHALCLALKLPGIHSRLCWQIHYALWGKPFALCILRTPRFKTRDTAASSYATLCSFSHTRCFNPLLFPSFAIETIHYKTPLSLADQFHLRTSRKSTSIASLLSHTTHSPLLDPLRYPPVAHSISRREDGRQRDSQTPLTATQLALDQRSNCKSFRDTATRARIPRRMLLALPDSAT